MLDETKQWQPVTPIQPQQAFQVTRTNQWVRIRIVRDHCSEMLFHLSMDGKKILCSTKGEIPDTDIRSFLSGPVLGCVLRLQGKLCLHAAVLSFEGTTFALAGDKGAGKSTTAAALLNAGAELVSDDIAVFRFSELEPLVETGYAAIRLGENALDYFGLDSTHYEPVIEGSEKHYVPMGLSNPNWRLCEKPSALKKLYFLGARSDLETRVNFKKMSSRSIMNGLIHNRYRPYEMNDQGPQTEFKTLAFMARTLNFSEIQMPNDLSLLELSAEQLLDDLKQIEA